MNLQGLHLISGSWSRGSGPEFSANNPATGEALAPTFTQANREQVDAALSAAAAAFRKVRGLDVRWPAALLEAMGREILALGDELLARAHAESGLPLPRLTGERARTVGQLNLFAAFVRQGDWIDATIDTADRNRQPMPKPDVRRMMAPRGPVVVFGASNFPLAFSVAGGDTASALAAGNPVIVKGHPSHPGTSELVAIAILRALESLNLPRGLFALLQGSSTEVGAQLVRHPGTAAVGFTGSQRAGRALFDLAAARSRPIPVYAEMGSLNPLIIMQGAIADRGSSLAKELADSILLGGGQFCTKPGLILLMGHPGHFVQMVKEHIAALPSATMLNQGLRDSFTRRAAQWSDLAGVTVHAHARPMNFASAAPGLYETTIETFLREPTLREEAFGPSALVVYCGSADEVGRALESIGGSLTGTVHTGAKDDPSELMSALEPFVGRVILNGFPTGVEVCHAMVHGGPYPATTDAASTSVGTASIRRFLRLVAWQNTSDALLPPALRNANPLGISRLINGKHTTDPIP
jgi:NADP-dependent aldehyde dehydrogenase